MCNFMHELKIIQDIFPLMEKVAKENHLKSINKVVLAIGNLRQIQEEFLQFAFKTIAQDTIAKGSELVIKKVPICVFCRGCQQKFEVKENAYVCPHCNGVSLEIVTGKEIILESVDGIG